MRDSTIGSEFREIAQEVKQFGERCVQASREWLNERRNDMTHRDQEGRRDYSSERPREQEQARRESRYGRGRSDYEDRPEYSARVQREARGYERGEGEYYGAHQFSERGQSPAWMEENRNWEYEGGPERLGSSGYEQGQQERWNRDPETRPRSQWAGSQRERGAYAARPGSYYSERPPYGTQPDLGYGTRPGDTRTQQSGRGLFSSGHGYEDYGTRSVYGGESAGSGGRESLYRGDYMSEDRMMDRDEERGPGTRYGSETARHAVSRGYSSMAQGYRGLGPKNYRRSDERLTEEINERLTDDDNLDASEITVRVADCKVTLEGTVDQRWMKHLAEDIAGDCSGVKEVDNRITVAPGSEVISRSTSTSRTSTTSTPSGTSGPTGTMPH